jgi:hypothetical protein
MWQGSSGGGGGGDDDDDDDDDYPMYTLLGLLWLYLYDRFTVESLKIKILSFSKKFCTVCSLTNWNASVTSRLLEGTAWLTAKRYKIFSIRVKHTV